MSVIDLYDDAQRVDRLYGTVYEFTQKALVRA
jgi:hypothetical protein